jgi:hypothetical protein
LSADVIRDVELWKAVATAMVATNTDKDLNIFRNGVLGV